MRYIKEKFGLLKHIRPGREQKADFRSVLLSHMRAHPLESGRPSFFFAFRFAPAAAFVALAVVLGTSGVTFASQNALPGELLYSIKIAAEKTRVAVSLNEIKKTELRLEFASRRLDEVGQLIEATGEQGEHVDTALAAYEQALLESKEATRSNQEQAADIAVVIDKAAEAQQKAIQKLSEKLGQKKEASKLRERLENAREEAEEQEDSALLVIVTATSTDSGSPLPEPIVKKSREKVEKKERTVREALRLLEEEKGEDSEEQRKEIAEKLKEAEQKIERAKERLEEGEIRASIEQSIEAHRITKELRKKAEERRKERDEREKGQDEQERERNGN